MKVSELSGALLNYWVAKAQGMDVYLLADLCFERETRTSYHPSENWDEAGPIIELGIEINVRLYKSESDKIPLKWCSRMEWPVDDDESGYMSTYAEGETALIAAMRVFVQRHFGDEVPDDQT